MTGFALNTVWISILFGFGISLVADFFIIEKLRRNYSNLYKSLGSPWVGWVGFRNMTYQNSFILMRNFKKHSLDPSILFWCNIKYLSLIFFILFCVALIAVSIIISTFDT